MENASLLIKNITNMKKSIILKLLALAAVCIAAACSSTDIVIPKLPPSNQIPSKPITPGQGITLYGWVADTDGKGIADVVVTDGYNVVTTDAEGVYQVVRHANAKFVYISVPSEYEIPETKGYGSYAGFYERIDESSLSQRSDFFLTKRSEVSDEFTIFGVGDPQPSSIADTERFRNETVEDLRQEAAKIGAARAKVAISLGDHGAGSNTVKEGYQETIKKLLGATGLPFYVTVGNHDKSDGTADDGEHFSEIYGPLYYSFNVGEVHFVCLDNCRFDSPGGTYKTRFTDEEVDWLEKDLAFVPKTKKIIVYYHIDVQNNNPYTNTKKVFDLISQYTDPVAFCGHTHNMQYNTITLGDGVDIPQVIHSAACGYFWRSTVNGDGVPNGYIVYDVKGTKIVNARFKGTKHDPDFQIRLYRGDAIYSNVKYELGADWIVANVFFAHAYGGKWKIEVYEDGNLSGEMTQLANSDYDRWSYGYHVGVKNHNPNTARTPNYHQFKFQLKNPSAKVTVKATDGFGNVYTQSDFTTNNNYVELEGYN